MSQLKNIFLLILTAFLIASCGSEEKREVEKKGKETSNLTKTNAGVIDENTNIEELKLQYEVKVVELVDGDCESSEDQCTNVYLEYPYFTGSAAEEANILGNRKVSELLGFGSQDPQELIDLNESAQKYFDQYNMVKDVEPSMRPWYAETKVIGHNYHEGVLSVKINSLFDLGTGEPSREIWALNINENTGEEIRVIDHVSDLESFIMLCENEFRNQFEYFNEQNLNSKGFTFEMDRFQLPLQYALTAEGLELVYNVEEIAPRSKGIISFIISYKKLGPLLDLSTNYNEMF